MIFWISITVQLKWYKVPWIIEQQTRGRWGWKGEGLIRGWATWRGKPLIWGHHLALHVASASPTNPQHLCTPPPNTAALVKSNASPGQKTRSLFSPTRNYVNGMQRALRQWWPIGLSAGGGLLIRKCKVGHPLTPGSLCKQCGQDARDSPNHSLNRARCCCHRQTVTNTRLDTAAV